MTSRLEVGQNAPAFSLPNQDGKTVSLADFSGKKVILYFYLASLGAAGYVVLGISKDTVAKLKKFEATEGLTFPLLSDPEFTVHKAYAAYGEKSMYGKTVIGVIRSTFVIDEAGKIEQALYNVKATGHVAMLRTKLGL
jgi:peroxiredoxin Q/BCP